MPASLGGSSGGSGNSNQNIVVIEESDLESGVHRARWDGLPEHLKLKESPHIPHHHVPKAVPIHVKFGLLFCKDFKLAARHKRIIALEMILPIICVSVLSAYVAILSSTKPLPAPYTPFKPDPSNIHEPFLHCNRILFSPDTDLTRRIAGLLQNSTLNTNQRNVHYSCDVTDDVTAESDSVSLCAAVAFHDFDAVNSSDLPNAITYELRLRSLQISLLRQKESKEQPYSAVSQWNTNINYFREHAGPRDPDDNEGGMPGYRSEGFLYLQQRIDGILMQLIYESSNGKGSVDEVNDIEYELVRFPHPPFHSADLVDMVEKRLPAILLVGVSGIFICNTYLLVHDKKSTQWFLKSFGVHQTMVWISWISRELLFHSIAILPIIGILCIHFHWNGVSRIGFIDFTEPSVLFAYLLSFYFNTICISIFISTFFSNTTSALTAAGFVNMLYFLQFVYVQPNYDSLPLWTRYLLCLAGPTGIGFGCQQLAVADITGEGVQWETLFIDSFGLGHIMVMLILGGCIIFVLALYVRLIYPTTTSQVAFPCYFMFKKWWWKGHLPPDHREAPIAQSGPDLEHSPFFQAEDPRKRKELQIQRLSKCFQRDVGLFNINMNFFNGEIAVVLGGHLSGKSTLLAVMLGNTTPNRGTVMVNRHNVQIEPIYARQNLGFCPQEDLLFDYLTVEELISFYVQLKGVTIVSAAFEEVGVLVKDLEISNLRKVRAGKLSLTQKRLVHIAIAFSGGSKVVVLDEPTQNMDHASKRVVWRFIDKEKEKRCIVILTKSAEEGYFLADRLAILVNGEIECNGSLGFILSKYGGGYHIVISKGKDFNKANLMSVVHQHIPDARTFAETESEIVMYLPKECTPAFPAFFIELEAGKQLVGYESFKVTHLTAEEVFRRVGLQVESQALRDFRRRHTVLKTASEALDSETKAHSYSPTRYYLNQFIQLFLKNLRFFKRRWTWIVLPALAPIILFILSTYLILVDTTQRRSPPLSIDAELVENIGRTRLLMKCEVTTSASPVAAVCDTTKKLAEKLFSLSSESNSGDLEVVEDILHSYTTTPTTVESPYLMAIEVAFYPVKTRMRVFFNNQPLHTLPIALNLISNVILHSLGKKFEERSISIINHPLPYTNLHELGLSEYYWSSGFFLGLALSWGMAFLVPIFVVMPIRERVFKKIQIMAGMNLALYWAAKLLWDLMCFFIVCAIICTIAYFYKTPGFPTGHSIMALGLFIMIFGVCAIAIVNSVVPLFHVSGLAGYFHTWFLFSIMGPVPMSIMLHHHNIHVSDHGSHTLHHILLALPNYAFGMGVFKMYSMSRHKKMCPEIDDGELAALCPTQYAHGCCSFRNNYHSFGAGIASYDMIILTVAVIAFGCAFFGDTQMYHTIKIEWRRWMFMKKHNNKVADITEQLVEHDFTDRSGPANSDSPLTDLSIVNLSNLPDEKHGNIVNMNLSIRKKECFGLIGVEGSGYETWLPLMVGLKTAVAGDVSLPDKNGTTVTLKKNYKQYLRHLGYCQQFPTLMPELTGKETLKLFGTLRRVPPNIMTTTITAISVKFRFIHELENLIAEYNPSSLKKLASAIALVGSPAPPYLLFHEPMSEIDQKGRELIINALKSCKKTSTVLVAASSLDVCEQLCDRLAIIVNGKIRCTGTPAFLRSLFCTGYSITAKLIPSEPHFYEKKTVGDEPRSSQGMKQPVNQISAKGQPAGKSSKIKKSKSQNRLTNKSPNTSATAINKSSKTKIAPSSKTGLEKTDQNKKDSLLAVPKSSLGKEGSVVFTNVDSILLNRRQMTTTALPPLPSETENENDTNTSQFKTEPVPVTPAESHSVIFQDPHLQFWEKELIPLMDYIEGAFPGAELVNIYPCFVHYNIPKGIQLSTIFQKMESLREILDIEAYTVAQGTLEQICINFTGGQKIEHGLIL